MVEIIEVHEIIVNIDDETEEKYLQTTDKLLIDEMQELLNVEIVYDINVVKCKFIYKDYLTNISTYKVKFYHKDK